MNRIDRIGNWFQTATGKQFWPLDPRPEDICIEDIAHALSNICRFGGHCDPFYSVAQHSVHVSHLVPMAHRLAGLLHDASEAYIGDMVRPLKGNMPEFQAAEKRIWVVIAAKFGLPAVLPPEVRHADNVALVTERRDIVISTPHKWSVSESPDALLLNPLPPGQAKKLFLRRMRHLYYVPVA